jgi:hypothetical protein
MKRNMNRIRTLTLCALSVVAITFSVQVQADGAGAFLGGIAVAKIGQNVRDRRDYEEDQAYYAQQQAQAAQSQAAASQPKTAEEKIAELDSLAAGGYITPEEYKSRKKAILDSM